MSTESQFVLEGTNATLEVYMDRVEIRPNGLDAIPMPTDGREIIFFKDVHLIAVREIGFFKTGIIEFGFNGIDKIAIAFDNARLNSLAVDIRTFVLKQMQKI